MRYLLRYTEKKIGTRGWERSIDLRLIKTLLCH